MNFNKATRIITTFAVVGLSTFSASADARYLQGTTDAPTEMPILAGVDTPTDMPILSGVPAPTEMPILSGVPAPTDMPTNVSTDAPTDKPETTAMDAPTDMPISSRASQLPRALRRVEAQSNTSDGATRFVSNTNHIVI